MQKRIEIKVHPLAALFPMMTEDELRELADDIKENGQQHPVLFDPDGVLLDGRNRMRACEIADVKPSSEVYSGDPVALIISLNINRRHMRAGQRAMAVAFAYPEPGQRGRGKKSITGKLLETSGFSRQRLDQARKVYHHSRDIAGAVLSGAVPLDKALAEIAAKEEVAASADGKYQRVRSEAPDLADLVDEHRMELADAIAVLKEREQREKVQRANLFSILGKVIPLHEILCSDANIEHVVTALRAHRQEFETGERRSMEQFIDACEELPAFLGLLKRGLQTGENGDEE